MTLSNTLDYLFIGHLCHDLTESGFQLGGTPRFGAEWVEMMAWQAGIFTSFGPDFQFLDLLSPYTWINTGSKKTTVFQNKYENEQRSQYLLSKAHDIRHQYLPDSWLSVPLLHLAPICGEIPTEILDRFSSFTFKCVTPQGWLRKVKPGGKVIHQRFDWKSIARADVVVLSDEEFPSTRAEQKNLFDHISLVIITKNKNGAIAMHKNKEYHFPAYGVKSVQKTGAGDVFASMFFLSYFRTKDLKESMIVANCAASLHVEGFRADAKLLHNRIAAFKRKYPM